MLRQIRKPETHSSADGGAFERDAAPWELKAAALKSDGDDALIETGRIFVRNLSYLCKQEDLETLFSPFGPIVETHLPLDMNTKKPKGGFCATSMFTTVFVNDKDLVCDFHALTLNVELRLFVQDSPL